MKANTIGMENMSKEQGREIIKDIIKQSHGIDVKTITVFGRRWFQKSYGNTYNTVSVMVNGETVVNLDKHYGYGDFYLQRAGQWLDDNGYIKPEHYQHGGITPLWQYCRDNNIHFEYHVTDVSREKDL
jgi:hypothetical protein